MTGVGIHISPGLAGGFAGWALLVRGGRHRSRTSGERADVEVKPIAIRKETMQLVHRDPTRRTAGQYARETVRRLRMRTLVTLGALAVATALLGRTFGLHDARFLASEVALLVSMFVISRYVLPLLERHDRGAQGEEHVGQLLNELTASGWRVIHDASFGRGNIDHILIGPPGVFTVETKSHPGPVHVRRVHGGTLSQAQAECRALERATGLRAEPLLVYSRAWVDRPMARRRGVRMVPARMLLAYLTKREAHLSRGEVEAAHARVADALLRDRAREVRHDRWLLSR
jgi:Nuclease-related domain